MSALLVERTRHWRTCDTCGGSGEVFVRHPNYGAHNCPYDGDDEPCPNRDCYEGVIEVWTDPLLAMRNARRMPWAYRIARDRAMKPVRLPKPPAPECYLARLRRTDPVAAEVLAPVLSFMSGRLAA